MVVKHVGRTRAETEGDAMSAEGRETSIRQSVDQVYEQVRDATLESALQPGPVPLTYGADNREPPDLR
jgi:hypothetical protein